MNDNTKNWIWTGIVALVASLAYVVTVADYVFPGESAHLMAVWSGLDAAKAPAHPIWGACVSWIAGFGVSPLRLNLFAVLSGVLATVLVFRLVHAFVVGVIEHEDVAPHAQGAGRFGGVLAAGTFAFAVAVWQSSTHLDFRVFDVAFAMAVAALLIPMARWPKLSWAFTLLIAVLCGIGMVESIIFLPFTALMFVFTLIMLRRNQAFSMAKFYMFIVVAAISYFVAMRVIMASFASTEVAIAAEATPWSLTKGCIIDQVRELRSWIPTNAYFFDDKATCYRGVTILCLILPFLACGMWASRGLGNDRTWGDYIFHVLMSVLVFIGISTPLAPSFIRLGGDMPVAVCAVAALATGYLGAYWFVVWRVMQREDDFDKQPLSVAVANRLGVVGACLFAATVIFTAVASSFYCGRGRGRFADDCANLMLDRLNGRDWIVTVGILDDHLRILAKERELDVDLVCLQRDLDTAYLKHLGKRIAAKGLKSTKSKLEATIKFGVKPFLEDWFGGNTDIIKEAVVFGIPDFWYEAGCVPVYDGLQFGGAAALKDFDGKKAFADYLDMWKGLETALYRKRGEQIELVTDPVDLLRLQLRRYVGFMGNNLGVALQDLELNDQAFAIYELVRKTIDPDNVSALFNEFEMARAGVKCAAAKGTEIERELKALVDNPTKRYELWSLSRCYGYVRSPEIFARMGIGWARSGATRAAINQVRRAFEFVPANRQSALVNMLGMIYSMSGDAKKSREAFLKVVGDDPGNHDALMGLAQLSLQEGSIEEAKTFMTRAVKSQTKKDAGDIEWAIIYLMSGDLARARLSLQSATDTSPNNLQAWGLLAHVIMTQAQQDKDKTAAARAYDEVEKVIVPKMEAIAGSPDNYHVRITSALALMAKSELASKDQAKSRELLLNARKSLETAFESRPDVMQVSDMILRIDISLDDAEAAAIHARNALRQNRRNPLANYAVGSLALRDRDYGNAEMYLRLAVDCEKPTAAALNDLSEVLRRIGRLPEAEKYARAAVAAEPELYVAWETLASALIDQNRDLKEAEASLKKAIELCKKNAGTDDIRMQITLARVQLKTGDIVHAKMTVRALQKHRKELTEFDREALDKVAAEVNGK